MVVQVTSMYDQLTAILNFLWDTLDQVILLYFGGGILTVVFAVWVVKKVARLFEIIVR